VQVEEEEESFGPQLLAKLEVHWVRAWNTFAIDENNNYYFTVIMYSQV
jgi:hypothetical protein